MNAIEIQGLSKRFSQVQALNQLSLTVPKGSIYALLGLNGAGKSTTMRCMLSMITPDEGKIEILGKDLAHHRTEILKQMGCMIEKPDIFHYLTPVEHLYLSAALYNQKVQPARVNEILELTGLTWAKNRKAGTFSQGMKQRLGLAMALYHNPEILILDEPLNGLDPQGIFEFQEMIQLLSKEQGKTVLISSHQLSQIEDLAQYVGIIHQGSYQGGGAMKELFQQEWVHLEIHTQPQLKLENLPNHPVFHPACIAQESGFWIFNILSNQVPEMIQWLTQNQVPIFQATPKKRLEELFFRLTQNTDQPNKKIA